MRRYRGRNDGYRERRYVVHGNLGVNVNASKPSESQVSQPRIKPRALKPGDTVGVVSPASAIDREHLERGVAALKRLGFRVKVSRHALDRAAIVAGSDEVRAARTPGVLRRPGSRRDFRGARRLRSGTNIAAARFRRDRAHAESVHGLFRCDLPPQRAGGAGRDGMLSRADGRDGLCARSERSLARSSPPPAGGRDGELRIAGARGA